MPLDGGSEPSHNDGMMGASRSMRFAMEGLMASHPLLLGSIIAGLAVIIATMVVIDRRAERSRH
jgi:hypothetical protein